MRVKVDANAPNYVEVSTQDAKPGEYGMPPIADAVILRAGQDAHHLSVELKPDEARIVARALVAAADEAAEAKARQQEAT